MVFGAYRTERSLVVNRVEATVIPHVDKQAGAGTKQKPPSKDKGDDHLAPSGLALPHVQWVSEEDWESHEFDKYSALRVVASDAADTE